MAYIIKTKPITRCHSCNNEFSGVAFHKGGMSAMHEHDFENNEEIVKLCRYCGCRVDFSNGAGWPNLSYELTINLNKNNQ